MKGTPSLLGGELQEVVRSSVGQRRQGFECLNVCRRCLCCRCVRRLANSISYYYSYDRGKRASMRGDQRAVYTSLVFVCVLLFMIGIGGAHAVPIRLRLFMYYLSLRMFPLFLWPTINLFASKIDGLVPFLCAKPLCRGGSVVLLFQFLRSCA